MGNIWRFFFSKRSQPNLFPEQQKNEDQIPLEFQFLKNIQNNSLEDCIYGCMIGQIIGDALGAFLEFTKVNQISVQKALEMPGGGVMELQPGQITDDSELALCILRGLNQAHDKPQINRTESDKEIQQKVDLIAKQFLQWYHSNPLDIGFTTKNAFTIPYDEKKQISEQMIKQSELNNKGSLSNGSLMRCSSLAVYCALIEYDFDTLQKLVQLESSLTHSNPCAQLASVLWVYTIQQLILNHQMEIDKRIQKVIGLVTEKYYEIQTKTQNNDLKQLWNCFELRDLPDPQKSIGFLGIPWIRGLVLLEDFQTQKQKRNFNVLMEEILNWGGDTDTNACIVGALFGSLLGFKHFFDYKTDYSCQLWVKKTLECKSREEYRSNLVISETRKLIQIFQQGKK